MGDYSFNKNACHTQESLLPSLTSQKGKQQWTLLPQSLANFTVQLPLLELFSLCSSPFLAPWLLPSGTLSICALIPFQSLLSQRGVAWRKECVIFAYPVPRLGLGAVMGSNLLGGHPGNDHGSFFKMQCVNPLLLQRPRPQGMEEVTSTNSLRQELTRKERFISMFGFS